MVQLIDLRFQRFIEFFVVISKACHRKPRGKIQIFLSVRIIEIHAFPVVQDNRETVVDMNQILFRRLYFIIHHDNTCFLHCLKWPCRFLCS